MPPKFLTNSIDSLGISSIGPSRQHYVIPWDRSQSNSIIIVSSYGPRGSKPDVSLVDEYLLNFGGSLKFPELRRYSSEGTASTFIGHSTAAPLVNDRQNLDLSDSVDQAFHTLTDDSIDDESCLYHEAGSVVDWFIDAPAVDHNLLINYLTRMPILSKHVLLASFANAEFSTECEYLINEVADCLRSENKRLAQSATAFLLLCCNHQGRLKVNIALESHNLPHKNLIIGIADLVG